MIMGLPVSLQLDGAPCLVLGDSSTAAAWVDDLLAVGALVTWPAARSSVDALPAKGVQRPATVTPEEIAGFSLVIASSVPASLELGLREARAAGRKVFVLGRPDLSSFQPLCQLNRADLRLTLESDAPVPASQALLEVISAAIPARLSRLLAWCKSQAPVIAEHAPEPAAQLALWREILAGTEAEQALAGSESVATGLLQDRLRATPPTGEVYLIGAGPGDPDLLTLRALRLLRQADVVLYDRLVAPAIMEFVRPEAERVYVGKRRAHHPVPQDSINALLVRYAKQGKRVARLKGGDPFIFGRGGEELETLLEEGIRFQVVPGITAASGCAAYAGIPLTHRDYAQACVFVTGHRRNGELDLDFAALARPNQTIVFYMGLQGLDELMHGLRRHGMSPEMPAALIQQGTTDNQQVLVGTVSTLPDKAKASRVVAPTLVIVGEVVRLREKLAWFHGDGDSVLFWPGDHSSSD